MSVIRTRLACVRPLYERERRRLMVLLVMPMAGGYAMAVDSGGTGMSQRWVLRPEPESAGAARVLVRSVCSEWGVEGELREDALLIVSELVSNVVDHAGTRCVLSVGVDDGELRIEVRDFYRCQPPRPRRTDLRSRRGRGLQLVSLLSARWGVTEFAGGKSVWASLLVVVGTARPPSGC